MAGRGTVRTLPILWVSTLFFNLVGAAIFAWLVTRSGVFGDFASVVMRHYALDKLNYPFSTAQVTAFFAGWLMTVLASASAVQRAVGTWIIGFVIAAGHFNHVVISATEIFMAIGLGAPITLGAWFERSFVPAQIGNPIGGVVFVTLLGDAHARSLRESEGRASGS